MKVVVSSPVQVNFAVTSEPYARSQLATASVAHGKRENCGDDQDCTKEAVVHGLPAETVEIVSSALSLTHLYALGKRGHRIVRPLAHLNGENLVRAVHQESKAILCAVVRKLTGGATRA